MKVTGIALTAALLACLFPKSTSAASWTTVNPLSLGRYAHTATLLPNGKVLAVGGETALGAATSAELFNPATGTWTNAGYMATKRYLHTATLLPNGQVLVAGGSRDSGVNAGTELYDSLTGAWTNGPSLNTSRYGHTATLLQNGQVLVTGGYNGAYLATAEIYDPNTGVWTNSGALHLARRFHTATLLPDGKVLVAGGENSNLIILTSAEIYDPGTGVWTNAASMTNSRAAHTATLLSNGKVLVVGGNSSIGITGASELYNPANNTWTTTGTLNGVRDLHAATLLPDGTVLVEGGIGPVPGGTNTAEVFNPNSGTWTKTNSLTDLRYYQTATLLPDGRALVAGGFRNGTYLASTEIYDSTIGPAKGTNIVTGGLLVERYRHKTVLLPNGKALVMGGYATGTTPTTATHTDTETYDSAAGWTSTSAMPSDGVSATATLMADGRVLATGGFFLSARSYTNVEIYDYNSGTWTITNAMTAPRNSHTATLLPDGNVLVAGGFNTNNGSLSSSELFNPSNGTWTVMGPLNTGRFAHTATLLGNGTVLVAGGALSNGPSISSAETFDPVTRAWTATGPMNFKRASHTATLLNNGKLLVTGGTDGTNALSSAELYDPASHTWTLAGAMSTNRVYHTATLLPNGKVLVAGGVASANIRGTGLATTELYDPLTATWTNTGPLHTARGSHTATLLPNGKVLIAGGYDGSLGYPGEFLSSVELFDTGLGYTNKSQPRITAFTSSVSLGNSLVITGAQFRGISGGSGGNSQDSSADYPVVQLRSIESGQTVFLSTTNWSTNSFASTAVWNFPPGWALVTVFVNGIQSTSAIVNVSIPAATTTISVNAVLNNGQFQLTFTNNAGAMLGVLATTNLSLPPTNWTRLGGVVETAPGQFQFTDPSATNGDLRYYRVFAP